MSIEVFKRTEKKYLLTEMQYLNLMKKIEDKLNKDTFYKSTICNIYYDTDDYDLISYSLEKPIYKEKIRLRSYGVPNKEDTVFLEIKKKYKGVVGKRRVNIKLQEFYDYIETGKYPECNKQIMEEIDYCFKYYNLKPVLFLGYDRLSYYDKKNKSFRITFDKNIRSREEDLNLELGDCGNLYFTDKTYIMEVKTLDALPLWFTNILSALNIFPTSFSKYGSIYKRKSIEVK
ncbi:MAG: polyphosphate polymerase domain-containing protein [Bacilli bacterium]|nr:polyphosphate polymerase domain-containing protein [Bacilli bacterium]